MATSGRMSTVPATPTASIEDVSSSLRKALPLPSEIIELIFWHMDEATFFISLETCWQFLKVGATRRNLLHQTRCLPGLRPGLEDLRGEQLLNECRARALRSSCMAWVLADIRKCKLPFGTMLSKSAFSTNTPTKGCWSQAKDSQVALANSNGTIGIYSLVDQDVRLTLTLDLHNSGDRKPPIRIGALAFSSKGDLVVLHEQGENVCDHDRKGNYHYNVVQHGPERPCQICEIYELTTFYCCNRRERDPVSCQRECRRSRVLASEGAKPVGIALACTGNVSIAWRIDQSKSSRPYRLEFVRTSKKPATDVISASRAMDGVVNSSYSQNTSTVFEPFPDSPSTCQYVRMNFVDNDKKLLLHNATIPLHNFSKNCIRGFEGESCYQSSFRVMINGPEGSTSHFRIGTPFHGTHYSNITVTGEAELVCVKSYLALGLLDVRDRGLGDSLHYLYILQYDETIPPARCKHSVYLDRGFFGDQWNPVALLAGWRQSLGTAGSLLEVTPNSNRIASAAWDRVLVWTMDPEQLHQGGLQHYFPPRDYNARKGFGRLRPILLPPQGVVHSMKWINNTELSALTDRGLVTWNVGPNASGIRDIDLAPGADSRTLAGEWQEALKKVLERAADRANETANDSLALAFRELYWISLHNPRLTHLLETLMNGEPTSEQNQDFKDYFEPAKKNDTTHDAASDLDDTRAPSADPLLHFLDARDDLSREDP